MILRNNKYHERNSSIKFEICKLLIFYVVAATFCLFSVISYQYIFLLLHVITINMVTFYVLSNSDLYTVLLLIEVDTNQIIFCRLKNLFSLTEK